MNPANSKTEEQGSLVVSSTDSTPSSDLTKSDQNMKRAAKQLIEKYYFQLTDGCGRSDCDNVSCASSSNFSHPNISKNQAALQAIELFKNKAKICESRPSKVARNHENSSSDGPSTSTSQPSTSQAASLPPDAIPSTSSSSSCQSSSSSSSNATSVPAPTTTSPADEAASGDSLSLYNRITPSTTPSRSRNSAVKSTTPSAAPAVVDPPFITEAQLHEIIETCDATSSWSLMRRTIGSVFNNPDSLMRSFHRDPNRESKENRNWLSEDLDKDKDEREEVPMEQSPGPSSPQKTGPCETTLDIESVRRAFKELFSISELPFLPAMINAIVYLSKSIEMDLRYHSPFERDPNYLNIFLIVMEIPELQSTEFLESAFPQFCKALGFLPVKAQAKLARVWATYPVEQLREFLDTLQQLITVKTVATEWTRNYCVNDDDGITGAAKVLKILFYASILAGHMDPEHVLEEEKQIQDEAEDNLNDLLQGAVGREPKEKPQPKEDPLGKELGVNPMDCRKPLIQWEDFINESLSETIEMDRDYTHYKADSDTKFTFMTHSFLLTTAVKSLGLYFDNRIRMMNERRTSLFQSLVHGAPTTPYLRLRIRRDHIIDDALVALEMEMDNPQDLKKQLYVEFEGEQGIDEGGVSKEFFQLVVEEIFNPDIGMFTYNEEIRMFWFNSTSFENDAQFTLIGIVLGLAIYNNVILDVHFPMVVYRKLMGKKGTFEDLKDSHPTLARSLQQMVEYEGDVEETFMQTFQISYQDVFGASLTHELKESGAQIPVTSNNRQEYVDLYADFLLNKSIEKQFKAFFRGFQMVTDESPLKILFRAEEIEQLVCGSQNFDFHDLETATEYDGGFTGDSTTIRHFWDVVHSLSEEQKRQLLSFTTGSDRVPVGGLSKLKLIIARNGPDSDRLPTSHTCFNVLLLPDYQNKDKLKERLLKAITYAKGFGML